MKRFFLDRRVSLVVALAALLGLVPPAAADDERPFKGWADEEVTNVEVIPDVGLRLTADGAGRATHLGRFTRHADAVVHADGTIAGTVTFIAANGDSLYADIDGAFTSATTIEGTYTFTGGTGRFEDSSGEADFTGVTTDGIHIAVAFNGTIDY
jgi:hypothetical protein